MSEISNYCLINKVTHFVVGGDLNKDFSRRHSSNTIVLNKFIADECLILCLDSHIFTIRYTFMILCNTYSLIYPFSVSENLADKLLYYEEIESMDNLISSFTNCFTFRW